MNKRGVKRALIIGIVLIVVFVILAFLYFSFFGFNSSSNNVMLNPVLRLSTEEAVMNFNEDFIYYMLYQIGAGNLRSNPLTGDKSRIMIYADEDIYSASIDNRVINVEKSEIDNPDIIIKTTKLEGVLMLQNSNYVTESFQTGKSSIELVANKADLFAKGYLKLYSNLNGKSVTGNIVRIYVG